MTACGPSATSLCEPGRSALGLERTCRKHRLRSEFDPQQTFDMVRSHSRIGIYGTSARLVARHTCFISAPLLLEWSWPQASKGT